MTTTAQAEAPASAAGPSPGWPHDWDRVLDAAIRTWGGRWDTARVQALYAVRYGRRLGREDARAFPSRRAHQGLMRLHDQPNARYYTAVTHQGKTS